MARFAPDSGRRARDRRPARHSPQRGDASPRRRRTVGFLDVALNRHRGGTVSDDRHYDVIVIGTGAGGGTFAHRLAPSGKRVLMLERGDYLPRERDNWDSTAVFVKGKYRAPEFWYDRARPRVPARGQLLRRGQHQVLRRRAVPAAPAGLRRAPPPRRDLPGVADRLRRPRAVLQRGRAPLPRARPARRGPDRGARERGVRLSAGAARAADPAAERRPGEAGSAPVPPADRGAPDPGRARQGHP